MKPQPNHPGSRVGTGFFYGLFHTVQARSAAVRRGLNRVFYNYLGRLDRSGDVRLMNYGYVSFDSDEPALELEDSDEADRNNLQLYHAVAGATNLNGKAVLEVGSGRGGGASFMMRYLKPRSVVGVDYARESVEFCRREYSAVNDLTFVQGDAEDLPIDDSSVDAVVNVESSHCYGDMDDFLAGVVRVLKPGGYFLWADHRAKVDSETVIQQMTNAGLEIEEREMITPNIVASLRQLGERNAALVSRGVPAPLRRIFSSFSGAEGTVIYEQLEAGELVYQRVAARKP